MNTEKSCGAVVLKREGDKVYTLVVRQNAGHWGFPKGHVENGETEEETAYREVLEETGVKTEKMNDFREETHYSPKPGVYKDVVYFLARPIGGKEKAQEDEIMELRWVTLVEAIALLTFDNDANLLRKAIRYLKRNDPEPEIWS